MKVSKLNSNGDWGFGRGKAQYIYKSAYVKQKVQTRLKSFKNDWMLDIDNGIDWIDLLGRKGTRNAIISEIERVTLQTVGVASIDSLDVSVDGNRVASISMTITDIYSDTFSFSLEVAR